MNAGDVLATVQSDNNGFTGNTAINNDGWGFYADAVLDNAFNHNNAHHNALGDFNF